MNWRSAALILFISVSAQSAYSQDKLIKRDGTELKVNIIETTDTEIRYRNADNPDGPLYTYPKSEFLRLERANGTIERFSYSSSDDVRISDWIRIDVEASAIYGQSFNAVPLRLNQSDKYGNGGVYDRNTGSYESRVSPQAGLNFTFGKDEVVTHIVGISYTNVRSSFEHSSGSGFAPAAGPNVPRTAQYTQVSVTANYNVLALNTGVKFRIGKGLNMAMMGSYGINVIGYQVSNGTRTEYLTVPNTSFPGSTTTSTTTAIVNERKTTPHVAFISLQGKLGYDFKMTGNAVGVFLVGSVSAMNRLAYCALGVKWYPFKKFEPAEL